MIKPLFRQITVASNTGYGALEDLASCVSDFAEDTQTLSLISEKAYRKLLSKGKLSALYLRFLMYVAYPTKLLCSVLFAKSGSCFIVTTNTFFAPLLAALAGRFRGVKVIHLLYDLFPDAMSVNKPSARHSPLFKLVGWIQKRSHHSCSATVYLGDTLKNYVHKMWAVPRLSAVIDVGANASLFQEPLTFPQENSAILAMRYGGQLGRMHDARQLAYCVDLLARIFPENVKIDFFASGVGLAILKERLSSPSITVSTPSHEPNWRESLRRYPIGLLSLHPAGAVVCLPSKLYGMLAAGQAVIAVCPIWSDVARILIETQSGWVINNSIHPSYDAYCDSLADASPLTRPDDEVAADFSRLIAHLLANPSLVGTAQLNARKAALDKFDLPILRSKWGSLLESVA